MDSTNLHTVPFLKWAGGKRWFTEHTKDFIPEFNGTYIEPFLGSGAVFFHLQPEQAILSDKNDALINTYKAIRDGWRRVSYLLKEHQALHSKEYYYEVRESIPTNRYELAARFIYLNRTCWNGLYRVNLQGKFNVPIGTKSNVILETDDFQALSKRLKQTTLLTDDFEAIIRQAGDGDFIFIDPPYTVKHNQNGFIKYNETLFSWQDQERLADAVKSAVKRGAKALVTNAAHESISELYAEFQQTTLNRKNVLSGKPEFRGKYEELIIKCWHQ
ncbi:DNA adenine methylase [Oceanospirillum beijerinckii]|uniref:DNA adenine methylase n=1 Tax=Oceanospirillum beijerinckii TaxID=64976 RepID=UPI000419DBD9|nr:Dam family site-specific DNA-(adenine-N6)-methyltransferase [Oceanospirillum beijerinckii]